MPAPDRKPTELEVMEQAENLTGQLEAHEFGCDPYLSKVSLRYLEGMRDALLWVNGDWHNHPSIRDCMLQDMYYDKLPNTPRPEGD